MDKHFYLGLDIGTTGCKTVVFDQTGAAYGSAYREYSVVCDKPLQAEQDADKVFSLLVETMREAVFQAKIERAQGLGISVQGDAVMPVDAEYRLLYPAVLGMDYRPKEQCRKYRAEQDEMHLYEVTGQPLHPINMLSKIMWFHEELPDIYEKAYKFITYAEFVMQRLGGEPWIDMTMASRSMGFDLSRRDWSDEILNTMKIDRKLLSEVCETGCKVGKLKKEIAEKINLKNCPLLIAGGHDQPVAAIGAGVISEGMALDSTGTAEVLSTTYRRPLIHPKMYESAYSCYFHAIQGMYFSFAHMQVGGILQRWYRDNFGMAEILEAGPNGDFYAVAHSKCSGHPSPVLVLPHFNGSGTPLCDMDSKGAIVGLTLSSTRHDILKGILDSLCYELRTNLETMAEAGIEIRDLRAVGGGARSPLWLQTKADITGRTIYTVECKEAGCLGAAIIAAVGCGQYPDIAGACARMVRTAQYYEPDKEMRKKYAEKYEIYQKLYGSLKEINHCL